MYAYRRLSPVSAALLATWMTSTSIENPVPAALLHVSVVACDADLPSWRSAGTVIEVDPASYRLSRFGTGTILVLEIDSPELVAANHIAREEGAAERWPYHPHLTLSYDEGRLVDLASLRLPDFPMLLAGERHRANDAGWMSHPGLPLRG